VQRNAQLLGNVDVGKARGVRDDGVGHERPDARGSGEHEALVDGLVSPVLGRGDAHAVAGLDAGAPATHEDLLDFLAAALDVAALEGVQAGHEARVLDHEGHQLGGIAADVEELEPVLLDEGLEVGVGGNTHAVSVGVAEDLAQGNEGLNIASGPNDLDDHIQAWGRRLAGKTTQARGDVSRGQGP